MTNLVGEDPTDTIWPQRSLLRMVEDRGCALSQDLSRSPITHRSLKRPKRSFEWKALIATDVPQCILVKGHDWP
jgi:hypothetical protein